MENNTSLFIRMSKVFHAVIFLLLIYLIVKTGIVFNFFGDFINNLYIDDNKAYATKFINFPMFIIIVLSILFSFIYLNLEKNNSKSKIIYGFMFVIFLLYFIILILSFRVLTQIQYSGYSLKVLYTFKYTSLTFIVLLIVIEFLLLSKIIVYKGNRELKIKTDNENFLKSSLIKEKNETIYYFKENKLVIIILLCILTWLCGLVGFIRYQTVIKGYEENQYFAINDTRAKVLSSHITAKKDNNKSSGKYKKVIVVLDFENSTKINKNTFTLSDGEKSYFTSYNDANDYDYFGVKLKSKAQKDGNMMLLFTVDKNVKVEDLYLKVTNKNITKKLKLNLKNDTKVQSNEYNIKDDIIFKNEYLKNSSFRIDSYEIKQSYNVAVTDELGKTSIVKLENEDDVDSRILKISGELLIDESLSYSRYNLGDLIEKFGIVKYSDGEDYYTQSLNNITPDGTKEGNYYFYIDELATTSNYFVMFITVRDKKYIITLK